MPPFLIDLSGPLAGMVHSQTLSPARLIFLISLVVFFTVLFVVAYVWMRKPDFGQHGGHEQPAARQRSSRICRAAQGRHGLRQRGDGPTERQHRERPATSRTTPRRSRPCRSHNLAEMATPARRRPDRTAVPLHISLLDVTPTVWRAHCWCPGVSTLSKLHVMIQAAMGGSDYHLAHLRPSRASATARRTPRTDDRRAASRRGDQGGQPTWRAGQAGFGHEVADLVWALRRHEVVVEPRGTARRMRPQVRLASTRRGRAPLCSDKLHNVRAIVRDYSRASAKTWWKRTRRRRAIGSGTAASTPTSFADGWADRSPRTSPGWVERDLRLAHGLAAHRVMAPAVTAPSRARMGGCHRIRRYRAFCTPSHAPPRPGTSSSTSSPDRAPR